MTTSRRTPEEVRQIIAEKIPVGLVKAEHTETAHFYRHTPSGLLLPSVTGITGILDGGDHLKKWAVTCAIELLNDRLQSGFSLPAGSEIDKELAKAMQMAHVDRFEDAGGIGGEGHGVAEVYIKKWIATGNQPADIKKFITEEAGEDYRLYAIARSVQKFINDYYAIPVASELKVAHVWGRGQKKKGYSGTLDALMYLAFPEKKPESPCLVQHDVMRVGAGWEKLECIKCGMKWKYYLCLVDFKTSNSIWKFPTPEGLLKMIKDEYVMQTTAYDRALKWMSGIKVQKIVVVRLDKAVEKYEIGEVFDRPGAYKAFLGLFATREYITSPHQKSATLAAKERVSVDDL